MLTKNALRDPAERFALRRAPALHEKNGIMAR